MARLFTLVSLVAAAAASNHAGEGVGLPFVLGSGGERGVGVGVGPQHGGGGTGNHRDVFLGGGNQHNIIGKGGFNGHHAPGQSISVTIITTNVGGGAKHQVWNEPPMQRGREHRVIVGGEAGLIFQPETVNAAIGDMVIFDFMSQNHTATQSTFNQPCVRMAQGIDSGFMPNPNNTVNPAPNMQFQVTTLDPVWMFCDQGRHCEQGMVFSINPTAEKSQARFKELAMAGDAAVPSPPSAGIGGGNASVVSATPTQDITTPQATIAFGDGQMGSGDACSCSCLCGMESWPQGVGLNSQGGLPGTIPMPQSSPLKRGVEPLDF
ncbi:hypothetical protein RJZ56_003954 [Blastomyces dermatitidis]|uniref:Serine-threonine rich protein n=2 Tax=Blastomyces TaxID=229219 RepID=A0A179UXW4_BLAGS|nr:uncharacterized protein BDBG_06193 [Blastomyces gilchristii SLH14081]XP_045271725.1 uncharacterized protein BDCG_00368 [Blastomyces dermatitidis ER-3]EEQ83563.1 hypothetical protein BDCG_00368 [Blastomyces dermatitidis ER-3]EQL28684.1 hypothetical protein BDFG_08597 [Blastomyces dermatitidis ATCC 26199]OAT11252.1 hypothetical protein BDBG_06193 [Blastomyces gilchristii SLH14081]